MGPAPLPKRVIEVPTDPAQSCRIRTTDNKLGRYAILSHCWGSSDITMKLKDSLIAEFQNTIPYEELPRSFQDAIQITRRLGFKYLWIDALCISQDNAEEWAEEAPKMSLYYGRSSLMISATAAEDSTRGILTNRHIRYSPLLGKGRNYQLRPGQLSSSYGIDSSMLATRGWAAQERVLAPRIVHYTTHQMVWECGHGHEFEASKTKYAKHIWDLDKAAIQPLVTDALQAIDTGEVPRRSESVTQNAERADLNLSKRLDAWHSCVQEYSRRNLALSSDKLHAISGIAGIINYDGEMGEYLAGVWSKHLGAGLAWSNANWSPFDTPPIYTAPSWSWTSVNGPVEPDTLGRTTEFLLPHRDKWLAQFDLKFIRSEMILQSPRNTYGTVMEGSHIVVEGACITKSGFSHLQQTDIFTRGNLAFDNGNKEPCSCNLSLVEEIEAVLIAGTDMIAIGSREEFTCGDSHCDFYLFLLGDCWYSRRQAVIDLLLMSWVSRGAAVAKRVGYAKILLELPDEELETVSDRICAADWKRMELRLV
ncbi:uncharacterized protein N0V89_006828 [Didymosphaeria variabile]|uniref:Heterokaryon incompatibility domain-containing protein n=1 Tax=Didymosphaeria variabile TaxID=1932322 RepID=A0A9W8XKB4_9PLEO|nr:uncharacterized protein N0V89_006828 [Didymosphaeria variabile]KAJ4351485.1 hypothetical protein N0V89_006828 [Didymosphaeria variabile]